MIERQIIHRQRSLERKILEIKNLEVIRSSVIDAFLWATQARNASIILKGQKHMKIKYALNLATVYFAVEMIIWLSAVL